MTRMGILYRMHLSEMHQITLSLMRIFLRRANLNRIIQRMEIGKNKRLSNQIDQVSIGERRVAP